MKARLRNSGKLPVPRLVIFGVAVALASAYLYFRETGPDGTAAKDAVLERAAVPAASAAVMTQPAVRAERQPAPRQAQPVTEDRRRILDSEDVLATLRAVQKEGTADQKEWAGGLLRACLLLDVQMPKPATNLHAEQRKRASEILRARCNGVGDLDKAERAALGSALRDPGGNPSSPLQKLGQMINNPDSRWSDSQNELVTTSLYGGDPILQRTALFAILQGNDSNAPGGAARQAALISVLGAKYSSANLSQFERLQECMTFDECDGQADGLPPAQPPTPAVRSLEAKYEDALARRLDARSILSIH